MYLGVAQHDQNIIDAFPFADLSITMERHLGGCTSLLVPQNQPGTLRRLAQRLEHSFFPPQRAAEDEVGAG